MAKNDKRIDQLKPSLNPLKGSDLFAMYSDNRTERQTLDSVSEYIQSTITTSYFTGGTVNGPTVFTDTLSACTSGITTNDLYSCSSGVTVHSNLIVEGSGTFDGLILTSLSSGTSVNNLGIDVNGNIIIGSTVTGGGSTGNTMFTTTTGLTANVTHTIEHNLNTENILIQIISSDGKLVLFSNVSNYQLNSVDVETTVTDTYTINIIGNGNVTLITGGTGTDSYTNNAYLSGNTIVFDNNIYGSDFYNVDLTPVLTGSSSISKFVTTSALTANVVTTISHTINSDDVIVQIKNSSGEFVLLDTINNYQPYSVDIVSSVSGTFKIIIIG